MPLPVRAVDSRCDACLGNRQCWVCLGQGRIERADGGFAVCRRCTGTGRCSYCSGDSPTGAGPSAPEVIQPDKPQPTPFC